MRTTRTPSAGELQAVAARDVEVTRRSARSHIANPQEDRARSHDSRATLMETRGGA